MFGTEIDQRSQNSVSPRQLKNVSLILSDVSLCALDVSICSTKLFKTGNRIPSNGVFPVPHAI